MIHFIKLHVLQVQLSKEDIETILNTLIYDGKVERSLVAGQGTSEGNGYVKLYRSVNQLIPTTGLMRMPCGACPVSNDMGLIRIPCTSGHETCKNALWGLPCFVHYF